MSKVYQRVELTANILIIVVGLLVVGVFIQRYLYPAPSLPQVKKPTIGSKVSLPNIDLSRNNKSVLLILQKGCHFCSESAEFYKKLITEAKSSNVKILAILPQNKQEAEEYLNDLGIKEIAVQQFSLSSINVSGTPTIIMVNNKGEVLDFWIGKLSSEKEMEVFSKLNS